MERPQRGADLAQTLQDQPGGRGMNPAQVYPTLQLLEDLGCVVISDTDGKRVYTITEEGRRYLAEHARGGPEAFDPCEWWTLAFDGERHALFRELGEFARLVGKEAGFHRYDAATLERVRATIAGARCEVESNPGRRRSASAGERPGHGGRTTGR